MASPDGRWVASLNENRRKPGEQSLNLMKRASGELAFVRGIVRVLRRTMPIAKTPTRTLGDLAETLAARYADRVALISDRETFTYRQWNSRANQYARWTRSRGLGKGDTIALLMPNRAEYLSVWLGIAKAGAATALLNTNLSDAALAHSINVVAARTVIVEASLLPQLESARHLVEGDLEILVHGESRAYRPFDRDIDAFSDAPLDAAERPALTINDKCIYVFTSGTTGLPKAANLNHYRVQLAMQAFAAVTGATEQDRIYDCLPMYHTNGGVLAPGLVLAVGGTCVIRERFSAREFWPDIARHRCTMFIYIGELCRYLLQAPPDKTDREHSVRLCVGNGLRPDVWVPFRDRFGVKNIIEFYASTEGNCSMFNFDSRPEAVGRVPKWAAARFPIRVIRFDVASEEPVRNAEGLCIECAPGEVGEVVGEILDDPARPGNRFEGYTDRQATERKVLRNVLRQGDAWFRTGDLMRRDALGYFFFVDRVGDTFRWKGENVATSQVSETITGFPGVREANVYGVAVPGTEGRAGMASLVLDDPVRFDLPGLRDFLASRLPSYAMPVFLRFATSLAVTGTFKQRKIELVSEGFDPDRISDPLFAIDAVDRSYRPLDRALFQQISAGRIRF